MITRQMELEDTLPAHFSNLVSSLSQLYVETTGILEKKNCNWLYPFWVYMYISPASSYQGSKGILSINRSRQLSRWFDFLFFETHKFFPPIQLFSFTANKSPLLKFFTPKSLYQSLCLILSCLWIYGPYQVLKDPILNFSVAGST